MKNTFKVWMEDIGRTYKARHPKVFLGLCLLSRAANTNPTDLVVKNNRKAF